MRWAEIQIDAEADAVDAVGAALGDAGCAGFEVRETMLPPTLAGYLPVDDRLEDRLSQLQVALRQLPDYGINSAGTELTLRYVEEADWANAWKAYYKPIRLGKRLVITPPWETPELGPEDLSIIVDPGMAFGTGSHPTTQLCLIALEEFVRPGQAIADVGTGSGILAIAAAKLGAASVVANDVDPLAVTIARENAAVNTVSIEIAETIPAGPYDLVVANILADVIIGMAEDFARWTKPNGMFIASGIIDTREFDVRRAVEAVGFTSKNPRFQGEWVALIFERQP
jgi:ribosomal protein L11 methyltransferase